MAASLKVSATLRPFGKSGDGGVDGVIDEDRLGLDRIYVQAKRYTPGNTVQRAEIQAFVGSLVGFGAAIRGKSHTIVSAWPAGGGLVLAVAVTLTPSATGILVEIRTKANASLGNTFYDAAKRASDECR